MEVPSLVWIFASFDFEQEVMPLPMSSSIIKKVRLNTEIFNRIFQSQYTMFFY